MARSMPVSSRSTQPFAKKFSQLFFNYGTGFAFDNFACTFLGVKNSVNSVQSLDRHKHNVVFVNQYTGHI